MDLLHHYEAISRQLISQDKSNFYIERSASASHQAIVHSVTGFQWHKLPVFTRCLKISHFNDKIRKVRARISDQANYLFSFGGKLVLICNVLSSKPLHLFHVLHPPATVV